MANNCAKAVPGTQLCHRALYATIVGQQPHDCPPGTSVKMTNDGPVVVDHVMRVARRYTGGSLRAGAETTHVDAVMVNNQTVAMNEELLHALEKLGSQNQKYEEDLNACRQQLELRKQEVQALQNKLRLLHMESKRRGSVKNTDCKKRSDPILGHSRHSETHPLSSHLRIRNVPQSQEALSPQSQHSFSTQIYTKEATQGVDKSVDNGILSSAISMPSQHTDAKDYSADKTLPNCFQGADFPLLVVEDVAANGGNETVNNETVTANSHSFSVSFKNGLPTPFLPQHLVSRNPGAMLFCNSCRVYFPPHSVSLTNHIQSERHQKNVTLPSTTKETYTQFGKLLQRMSSFVVPSTVVSEEEKSLEKAVGNTFFENGFDIVYSMCFLCKEIVTTQSYKVHESLASHRKRVEEANAKSYSTA